MKNIKVGPKLIFSYLAITVMAIIVCVYLLIQLSSVNHSTEELHDKAVLSLSNMVSSARMVNIMRMTVYQALLARNRDDRREVQRSMDSLRREILDIYKKEETRTFTEEGKKVAESVAKNVNEYADLYNKFVAELDKGQQGVAHTADDIPDELPAKAAELIANNRTFVTMKENIAEKINDDATETYKASVQHSIMLLVVMVIFALGFGIFMMLSITRPLNQVVNTLKKGEDGDMRARSGVKQEDEIGIVASAVDHFFEKIQSILKGIHMNSETLAGASEELSAVSRQLASGAEETVAQSNTVASTTEQMAVNINAMASGAEQASVNANEVAGAAEEMSVNMNTIAAAVEEMSASINQIAGNTGEVKQIATEATEKARDATDVMSKLGAAAKEIGQVTDVIKKIADKTNLLALNATIEAASAGESGKGFAVVAGEIKELANQSAQSADDITRRIDSIQSGTGDAVEVIQSVSDIIDKINHSVEAIAGHVDQQTKASNEIANNVAQANTGAKRVASAIGEVAKGTNDVSRNAGEAAGGAKNVSSNAVGMSQVAKESSQGATQVNQSAGDLSRIAGDLRETVSKFKI